MTTEHYFDTEDTHRWYTEIPNMVDDMGLDPYAFRLYAHIRRVVGAGDDGACWQSTNTLAKICKMSTGAVSKAKRALEAAELIRIEEKTAKGTKYHHITVINIWAKNAAIFKAARSQSEPTRSQSEPTRSPGETKNNHVKNNHEETTPTAVETARPTGGPANCGDWIELVKTSTNKNAALRRMFITLYPDYEPPTFGYVGTMAAHRDVGGPVRLAQLLWQANSYRVTGDPLRYCIGLARGVGERKQPGHAGDSMERRDGKTVVRLGE